ncbi:hypothetical protein Tco_1163074 [Tanacetum coccineum]
MDTLEQQLTKETILESNCQNAFRVLKTQFEKIFSFVLIKPSSLDVDASLVNTKSIGTESKEHDTSSRSGNDAHADNADIRPIYDEEPMVEVQTTAKINIFATEQPEFNNEGKIDQNVKQWKPALQPRRNQSVVRQPTAFKSERPRISKQRFASQVDVNNDLSKPVTTHYLPKERESAVAKPHHMIAPGSSRTVGLRWVPTGKIFTPSTTKVDSEPPNGSNANITNQYEKLPQNSDVSAGTSNLSAGTSFNPKKEELRVCSELGIHDHNNELSSSKLVPKVVPPADKTATSRQERPYALSWKPYQGDSLNLPDHRYQVYQGRLLASFQDDAKYEHVGQDTRSQGGKDDQDMQGKI